MDYHANVVMVMNVTHKDAEKIIAMAEEDKLQPDYWIKQKDGYDTLQWDCINQKEKEKISQFYRDKN